MLVDVHCHLTDGRLWGRLGEILPKAEAAGVAAVVCAADGADDSMVAAEVAHRYRRVYCTAGVHPHHASHADSQRLHRIEELARDEKNVAIGEIGLDYFYDYSPREDQRRVFAAQLQLAHRLGKCVQVHTRESLADTLALLAESGIDGQRVLLHSFTEDAEHLRRVLDTGAMVSFSGIVTFRRNQQLREVAAIVPDDRILVETDSPYLSPEPVRAMKVNEPANVVHVAACLAEVRNVPAEDFAELTTANAARFFALEVPPLPAQTPPE